MKKARLTLCFLALTAISFVPSCGLAKSAVKLPGSLITAVGRTVGVVKNLADNPQPMTAEDAKFLDEFAKKQEAKKQDQMR